MIVQTELVKENVDAHQTCMTPEETNHLLIVYNFIFKNKLHRF